MKATTVIAGIALLAIGYVGGAYIGLPSTDKDQMQGDISQAEATKDDPDMEAMRDLLAQDPESQQRSIASVAVLSSRIDVLDSLAEAGVKATSGSKDLQEVNKYFVSLQRKTGNALACFNQLMRTNEQVIKGEKVDNFNEVSNKALLSFVVLDNALSSDVVGDMLDYTREINNQKAADAIAGWMAFCSENAEMQGNENDVAMWQKVYTALSAPEKQMYDKSKTIINDNISRNLTARISGNDKLKNANINDVIKSVKADDKLTQMAYVGCNQGIPGKK